MVQPFWTAVVGDREFVQSRATKEGEIFGAHVSFESHAASVKARSLGTARLRDEYPFLQQCGAGLILPCLAVLPRLADALDCNISELVGVFDRKPLGRHKTRKNLIRHFL
jgi:hypothetical protein